MCKGPQQAVDASGLVLHSLSDTLDKGGFADTSEVADEDYFVEVDLPIGSQIFWNVWAVDADGYDSRKTKAKGRSATIMTGSKGIEDETVTLGKKSLLGQ